MNGKLKFEVYSNLFAKRRGARSEYRIGGAFGFVSE
jgi:hypothetical protein